MCPARLTFEEAESALAAFQTRGWRLGLDRMNAFVDELGLREVITGAHRPLYFHVAGTNGKGSTTCYLQHLLHGHGYRVGACYSPYVYDVRERVQLGLDLISKEEFAACTEILLETGARLEPTEFGGPTEFEMKTAMGFLAWKRAEVNAVALETGLGGRLDATNVVDPACSIITSIGLDHTEHLGSTLAKIAAEKAGIIKPARPVIVGALPSEALSVIVTIAKEKGCPIWLWGRDIKDDGSSIEIDGTCFGDIEPGMMGSHQRHNAALALAALAAVEIPLNSDLVRSAIRAARLPGRMEVYEEEGRLIIRDGAHNEEAAHVLAQALREKFPGQKFSLIWGMLQGHDPQEFLMPLRDVVESVFPVELNVAHRAGWSVGDLSDVAAELGIEVRSSADSRSILVAGSFYLLSQTKKSFPG